MSRWINRVKRSRTWWSNRYQSLNSTAADRIRWLAIGEITNCQSWRKHVADERVKECTIANHDYILNSPPSSLPNKPTYPPTGSDWIDPDDPNVIAENELLSAALAIEAAAKKLAQLKPRKRTGPRVSIATRQLLVCHSIYIVKQIAAVFFISYCRPIWGGCQVDRQGTFRQCLPLCSLMQYRVNKFCWYIHKVFFKYIRSKVYS